MASVGPNQPWTWILPIRLKKAAWLVEQFAVSEKCYCYTIAVFSDVCFAITCCSKFCYV